MLLILKNNNTHTVIIAIRQTNIILNDRCGQSLRVTFVCFLISGSRNSYFAKASKMTVYHSFCRCLQLDAFAFCLFKQNQTWYYTSSPKKTMSEFPLSVPMVYFPHKTAKDINTVYYLSDWVHFHTCFVNIRVVWGLN